MMPINKSITVSYETYNTLLKCRKFCLKKGIENLNEPFKSKLNTVSFKELFEIAASFLEKELIK